jgi:hypothetical protein
MNLMEELYHGGPVRACRKRLKVAVSSVRAALLIMDPILLCSRSRVIHAGRWGGPSVRTC